MKPVRTMLASSANWKTTNGATSFGNFLQIVYENRRSPAPLVLDHGDLGRCLPRPGADSPEPRMKRKVSSSLRNIARGDGFDIVTVLTPTGMRIFRYNNTAGAIVEAFRNAKVRVFLFTDTYTPQTQDNIWCRFGIFFTVATTFVKTIKSISFRKIRHPIAATRQYWKL